MAGLYRKEEIEHLRNIPARILHQMLDGCDCDTSLHWHHDIEINLVLQGEGVFTVEGHTYTLAPGEFIVINSEDMHMGEGCPNLTLAKRHIELITILFDYDFLFKYVRMKGKMRLQMPENSDLKKEIRDMIIQIGILTITKSPCYEIDITILLLQIGSILLKYCCVESDSSEGLAIKSKIQEIQNAIVFIEDNYALQLTLNDVAESAHLSPAYFSRRFKQVTGITFHEYLENTRLRKSMHDIQNTDLSINDIAYNNGFPNVKSFINAFKNRYKTTPYKYRVHYVDNKD